MLSELESNLLFVMLAKVTVLLLAGWGAHWLFRHANPRWRVTSWRLMLFGLIVLPVLTWIGPDWQIEMLPAVPELAIAPGQVVGVLPGSPSGVKRPVGDAALAAYDLSDASSPVLLPPLDGVHANAPAVAWISSSTTLVSAWLIGATILMGGMLRNVVALRRLIRATRAADQRVIDSGSAAIRRTGLANLPELRVSNSATVPFATGIFHPTVVMPQQVVDTATEEELRLILTHEIGHVAGRDILWSTIAWTVRCLLWFHPLIWRMPRAHQVVCETVCDSLAAPNRTSRTTYRRVLAQLALSVNSADAVDRGIAMSATAEVTRRIRRLAVHIPTEALTRRRRWLAVVVGVIGSASIAAATFVPVAPDETTQVENSTADPLSEWQIQLKAVDSETGLPISNPRFIVQLGEDEAFHLGDTKGEFTAMLPSRNPRKCYLKVRAEGYTPMRALFGRWNENHPVDELPEKLTFEMAPGITIGGTVIDEQGKPVRGATVNLSAAGEIPGQRIQQAFRDEVYITDTNGRWRCPIAPRELNDASIQVNHPDFALNATSCGVKNSIEELKTLKLTLTLKRGFVVRGVVTGPNGKPVEGAHVAYGAVNVYHADGPSVKTDSRGRYEFQRVSDTIIDGHSRPLRMSVTVLKKGLAPQMAYVPGTGQRKLDDSTWEIRKLNFQLDKGEPLTVSVTDTNNKPVKDVWFVPSYWHGGSNGLAVLAEKAAGAIPTHSNENGVWHWENAPSNEKIRYDILPVEHLEIRQKLLVAGNDQTIKLLGRRTLVGKVIDSETRADVDFFVIQQGFANDRYPDGVHWTNDQRAKNGRYKILRDSGSRAYRFRFVSDGYEPFITEPIPPTEGEIRLDVELKRVVAEQAKVVPSGDSEMMPGRERGGFIKVIH